jgi:tetratricopeptide (TPR) repeat protein
MEPVPVAPAAQGTCFGRLFRRIWRAVPAGATHADAAAEPGLSSLLDEARTTIRLGFYDHAQAMLLASKGPLGRDPRWLNLMGLTYEAQGRWSKALRCYGKAVRADRAYGPACQNLRRLYELETFGHSAETIALGDENLALAQLLSQLRRSAK